MYSFDTRVISERLPNDVFSRVSKKVLEVFVEASAMFLVPVKTAFLRADSETFVSGSTEVVVSDKVV
jgi:hypothetical protein